MATQEQIDQLKSIKEQTGASNEQIQDKIKEMGLGQEFINMFNTTTETTPVDTSNQTTVGVKGANENQVIIPGVNTVETPVETPTEAGTTMDGVNQAEVGKIEVDRTPKELPQDTAPTELPKEPTTETTPEETKVEEPTTDQIDLKTIQTVEDWKNKTGGGMDNLESWVEARYGTIATQKDGKLTAEINGKQYEWTIDDAGNPIRVEIPAKSDLEAQYDSLGYSYTKNSKGEILLQPKDLNEALDMYMRFGKDNVKIDPNSKEAIVGSKLYDKVSKYKGASVEVFYTGFKDGDIGIGGETWDLLVKANGGQPTPEMLAARTQYENDLKIDNVNNTTNVVNGTEITPTTNNLTDLDNAFLETMQKMFGELSANWEEYKNGNEKMNELQDSLNQTTAEIDKLNLEKRRVLDQVKENHPGLSIGQQLAIADKQLDAIDDQLFVLQRQYNMDYSTYTFESEKAKGEFEWQTKMIDTKMQFAENLYGIQRGDAIRYEDIARQDKLIQDQYDRADFEYNRAVEQGDYEAARDYAYQLAYLEEQQKYNKENENKFQGFSTTGGLIVFNPKTGETEFKSVGDMGGGAIETPYTPGQTYTGTVSDFIKQSEGFRNTTYDDATGKVLSVGMTAIGTPTIGYGFTTVAGQPVVSGMQILKDGTIVDVDGTPISNVDTELQNQIANHSNYTNYIDVPLTEAQKTALTSFEYNLGPNIWEGDGASIIDKINSGNIQGAANDMLKFTYANGEYMEGLANRRKNEANLLTQTGDIGITYSPSEISALEQYLEKPTSIDLAEYGLTSADADLYSSQKTQEKDYISNRLARNNAINIYLGETDEIKPGINRDLVNQMGNTIEEFIGENQELVNKFNLLVTGDTSKTSDKEQILKFNKAIAESALTGGDLGVVKDEIRNVLLKNSEVGTDLETAQNILEGTQVIEKLVNDVTGTTGITTKGLETIAKTIGQSSGENITSIDQITGKMLASYVKSISGVAVSEQEYQRLASQLPSIKDNPTRFNILLENFKNETIRENTVRARQLLDDNVLFNDLFPIFTEDTGSDFFNEMTGDMQDSTLKFNF